MKRVLTAVFGAAILFTSVGGAASTASAMPSLSRSLDAAPQGIKLDVQYRGDRDRRDYRNHHRRGFHRDGHRSYYNGYRGHVERRAGYRYHNGYWFPSAAFIAGAIVGNTLNPTPPRVVVRERLPQAHIRWCHEQFRSYRASDNTFQPFSGPRRVCTSPFG